MPRCDPTAGIMRIARNKYTICYRMEASQGAEGGKEGGGGGRQPDGPLGQLLPACRMQAAMTARLIHTE